jgi:hypothetical protein
VLHNLSTRSSVVKQQNKTVLQQVKVSTDDERYSVLLGPYSSHR